MQTWNKVVTYESLIYDLMEMLLSFQKNDVPKKNPKLWFSTGSSLSVKYSKKLAHHIW